MRERLHIILQMTVLSDTDDCEYKEFDKKYGKIIEFNDKFKI